MVVSKSAAIAGPLPSRCGLLHWLCVCRGEATVDRQHLPPHTAGKRGESWGMRSQKAAGPGSRLKGLNQFSERAFRQFSI